VLALVASILGGGGSLYVVVVIIRSFVDVVMKNLNIENIKIN
jgi:hypothetical protein